MPRSVSATAIFSHSLRLLVILLLTNWLFAQDFKKQVIYQIVTDRFFNGDSTNDNPPQSAGLFDSTKTNWHLYWAGDLAGIQQKLSYLHGVGVTAIWISPPLDNLNLNTRWQWQSHRLLPRIWRARFQAH